jgi:hypothetical protein
MLLAGLLLTWPAGALLLPDYYCLLAGERVEGRLGRVEGRLGEATAKRRCDRHEHGRRQR